MGLIPEWGRSPGEGNGKPFQYSCLENSTGSGVWWAIAHEVTKSWTWLIDEHTHTHFNKVKLSIFLYLFILFIYFSWRLIILQYWSGFCHTLTWISHGYTCIPHPDPPSHLPLHPIPLGLGSAKIVNLNLTSNVLFFVKQMRNQNLIFVINKSNHL